MIELLTAEHFRPHVDKVFRVQGDGHAFTLTEVTTAASVEGISRQPFSLVFRGPPDNVLPEGFYRLEVDDGPSFELYVMPIHTPAQDRQDYQAAFN
jgi:hypothetical protein